MNYIIIIVAILCGYKIYKNKGQARFDWFICCVMLFSSFITIVDKPQLPCHRFFILCYWASILRNHELQNRRFPLKYPLLLYTIGIVIIGINSSYLSLFYKLYKPFMLLIDTYFIVLLGFYGTKNETFNSKKIIYVLLFVTIYGIITFVISRNPIQEFVSSAFGKKYIAQYYFGIRTRIDSTWSHPIAYGFVCAVLFFKYLQYASKSLKIRILLFLLAFNVLICGSRTALAAFFIMGAAIVLMRFNFVNRIKVILAVIVFTVPLYMFVPMVQNKVHDVVLTAMGDDSVSGSSLEMRDAQTDAVMYIVSEAPLLGHGISYILEVMNFGTDNFIGDKQLFGLESYIYIILIERGFFGAFLEVIIVLSLLFYAVKYRKNDLYDTSFMISIVIGFIFFSVSTGTLDIFTPVMFMIGVTISEIQYKKELTHERRKKISYSNTCL